MYLVIVRMYKLTELSPEFFSRNNISTNHMISSDSKGVKSSLVPLQVQERGTINRQCTFVKILIDHKYYVRHLNKNISIGSNSTTNEAKFQELV